MLFSAELPEFCQLLPEELQSEMRAFREAAKRVKSEAAAAKKASKLKRDGDEGVTESSPKSKQPRTVSKNKRAL